MQTAEWKKDYEEFEKVTRQFYAGEVPGVNRRNHEDAWQIYGNE